MPVEPTKSTDTSGQSAEKDGTTKEGDNGGNGDNGRTSNNNDASQASYMRKPTDSEKDKLGFSAFTEDKKD